MRYILILLIFQSLSFSLDLAGLNSFKELSKFNSTQIYFAQSLSETNSIQSQTTFLGSLCNTFAIFSPPLWLTKNTGKPTTLYIKKKNQFYLNLIQPRSPPWIA